MGGARQPLCEDLITPGVAWLLYQSHHKNANQHCTEPGPSLQLLLPWICVLGVEGSLCGSKEGRSA